MSSMQTTTQQCPPEVASAIARKELGIKTLEARNMDSLDFHEVGVWQVRDALEAAYCAGLAAGKREAATKPIDLERLFSGVED